MGSFTTIVDALGREWQIKTGNDAGDTYKIGEIVDWHITKYPMIGTLMDDVYWGTRADNSAQKSAYIVISKHVVTHVIPSETYEPVVYDELYAKYAIRRWESNWWTAKEWAHLSKLHRQAKREKITWRRRIEGLSAEQVNQQRMTKQTDILLKTLQVIGQQRTTKQADILQKTLQAMGQALKPVSVLT